MVLFHTGTLSPAMLKPLESVRIDCTGHTGQQAIFYESSAITKKTSAYPEIACLVHMANEISLQYFNYEPCKL